MIIVRGVLVAIVALTFLTPSFAQELEVVESQTSSVQADAFVDVELTNLEGQKDSYMADMSVRSKMRDDNAKKLSDLSLFFTAGELNLIRDAEKGLVARPVTETEITEAEQEMAQNIRPPMGPREIAMGGIIYKSSNDWAVWINGEKITPERIPEEVLDIRVYKDTVRLKWFDAYTNQVFPIKMRSHQRFNIDTRIFLPG